MSATVELSPPFGSILSRVGFPVDRPYLERVHQVRWISEDRLAIHTKVLAPGVERPRTAIGPAAPVGTNDSDPRRHPMTANRALRNPLATPTRAHVFTQHAPRATHVFDPTRVLANRPTLRYTLAGSPNGEPARSPRREPAGFPKGEPASV